ncbi:hypothetical protein JMJ77_0009445 [Colletotrichum scovillei]|uniref:Secreted protein n=1 Tax=Colletotrichum scovillei TaxID=1209932 RepID=A0A9P7QY97_9PEZI|nr:hypothetical protein JMJ77_0009445 [Colletotrichum scovillei]KAG7052524.1 hypothetical protein JMJ78_0005540 [Colletotrichum scovillei]KAG7064816.1 hypothetical protein JMJ76_0012574 [Colletotrichum scovillei]
MRLRIYCITSLFVLNIGVQVDHLSRTASTSAFYSTTATPYGFHICFCGGSIRQKCQLLFFDIHQHWYIELENTVLVACHKFRKTH